MHSQLAQHPSESIGRLLPEAPHSFRNCFQRDRDRIVHSTAFRRLDGKTQVFLNGQGDYYRTRLTHTIEVASISRTIARTLGLNEDLCEAIALAHDLGHPPSGHAGERTLHELMHDHGGFDHNEQSLRVVEVLEESYPQHPGLNLSYEVLEGLRKHHSHFYTPARIFHTHRDEETAKSDEARRKQILTQGCMSTYRSSQNLFPTQHSSGFPASTVDGYEISGLGESYSSPSLEAQVVDLSDEIAYYSHDLDDGIEAGLLELSELENLTLWNEAKQQALAEIGSLVGKEAAQKNRKFILRCLINHQVEELITSSKAILTASGAHSIADVRKQTHRLIRFSKEHQQKNNELRRFLYQRFYRHSSIAATNNEACERIKKLFEHFIEEPKRYLGEHFLQRIEICGTHRAVCDYIAGMTDRYVKWHYDALALG